MPPTCCFVRSKFVRASVSPFLVLLCVSFCLGQQPKAPLPAKPIADFTDVAEKAGLTMQNIFGGS